MRLRPSSARLWFCLVLAGCGSSGHSSPGGQAGASSSAGNTSTAGNGTTAGGSGGTASIAAAGAADSGASNAGAAASGALQANAGASRYAAVGEDVVLDGSGSQGAVTYQWNAGDGSGSTSPKSSPIAHVTYTQPGRYHAVLTVADAAGVQDTAEAVITVTYPATFQRRGSSTIAPLSNGKFAVVSPDSNQLVIVVRNNNTFAIERRIATGANPRTVVEWQGMIAVACQTAGTVELYPLDAGPAVASLTLPYGSAPYG